MDRPPSPKNAEVPILENGESWDAGSSEQADNAYVSLKAERLELLVEMDRIPVLPSATIWRKYIARAPSLGKLNSKLVYSLEEAFQSVRELAPCWLHLSPGWMKLARNISPGWVLIRSISRRPGSFPGLFL